MAQVRPWVKVAGIAILVLAIVGCLSYFGKNMTGDKNSKSSGSGGGLMSVFSGKPTYTIGVNTYAGFMPIVWLNGGLKPNDESILTKEYGIKLDIVIQDDFVAGRNGFKKDEINMIYCTADALPIEMGEGSDMSDARHFMLLNWSRGADAIVANKNIKTVADLKGKKIAVAEGTAAHTLLINTLETNGIKPNEVTLVRVESGLEAAQAFKALQVDACVTWSPDDADCVDAVQGSKVLVSTKQATNIICDGLIAKESFLDENKENVSKLVSAILYANSLMNTDEKVVKEASEIFAKCFGTNSDFALNGSKNIRYATLGDEENFYGLNSSYTGVKGDELYSKMSRIYESIGLTKKPLAWRKASNSSIIEGLLASNNVSGNQEAETMKTFNAPTKEIENKQAFSDKKLTIEFPVNGDVLDSNARSLIDREFVGIAKQFSGARIRVEGNTDNTGNQSYNVELSKKRAQAVVDYLVKEYSFDKNRFIVVGNGPKHAIEDGVVGSNKAYRTTDFQLISE